MIAIVGVDVGDWSLRDLQWATDAKRRIRDDDQRDAWNRVSYEIYWIVNSMPNLSKHSRPLIPLHRIDPFLRGVRRSGLSTNQMEKVLDRWAERGAK